MSDQFKSALIIIAVILIGSPIALYQYGAQKRKSAAQEATAAEAFQKLPLEQKIRQKVAGITEYQEGETVDGQQALQLTIQLQFIGARSPLKELNHRAATDLQTISQLARNIETIDIQYNAQATNAYGEISYKPVYYIEIDRPALERIQWRTFAENNLPAVASVQTNLE